ncbi:ribonuclease P protein component [bacterium]|nr:ribonuclease P protein component [bacterium]
MDEKYWPVVVPREETALLFPVKQIDRSSIADYLKRGHRYTFQGITLYSKPTDILEVGFLIRAKAGNAVHRNKTRRLFRGLIINAVPTFSTKHGYLFLFHRSFFSTAILDNTINQLITRIEHAPK